MFVFILIRFKIENNQRYWEIRRLYISKFCRFKLGYEVIVLAKKDHIEKVLILEMYSAIKCDMLDESCK